MSITKRLFKKFMKREKNSGRVTWLVRKPKDIIIYMEKKNMKRTVGSVWQIYYSLNFGNDR